MSARERMELGTDPNGRKLIMTRRMKAAFDAVTEECGFTPEIVQGAFMASVGGGAAESAGYHDLAGCIDTRTWDIDDSQEKTLIRAARSIGWAVWKRDAAHGGMDEHMHWVLLGEAGMAKGAREQEADYRNGLDGLASRGRDYHWRPSAIRQFDYDKHLEGAMPTMKELKEELAPAIVNQMMKRDLNKKGMTVADALRQASHAADLKRLLTKMPSQVAKAIDDALPEGDEPLTRAQVRAASRAGAELALKDLLVEIDKDEN